MTVLSYDRSVGGSGGPSTVRERFNQSLDINFVVHSYMYANHCVLLLSRLLDYQV